jgi:hypothetical protein
MHRSVECTPMSIMAESSRQSMLAQFGGIKTQAHHVPTEPSIATQNRLPL